MIFFKKLKSTGLEPRCNTLSEPASSWQIVQSILSHLSDSPSTMCPIDTVSRAPVRRAIMQLCSGRFSALGQFWRRGCEVFSDVYCSPGHLYATTYCLQGVPSWPLLASVQKHSCLHNDHLNVCLISSFRVRLFSSDRLTCESMLNKGQLVMYGEALQMMHHSVPFLDKPCA